MTECISIDCGTYDCDEYHNSIFLNEPNDKIRITICVELLKRKLEKEHLTIVTEGSS